MLAKAEGHNAKIVPFDAETVLVPFRYSELTVLVSAVQERMEKLESSGDYPEKGRDLALLRNLQTARTCIINIT